MAVAFGSYVNNFGTFTIAPGTSAILGAGRSFVQSAGALNIPAGTPFNMNGGSFTLSGGTVSASVVDPPADLQRRPPFD